LFVGALVALGTGVLGLTAQNVLTDDDPAPVPTPTATAIATGGPSASPSGSPVGAPALTIVSPADEATLPVGPVAVSVDVSGFRIAPTATTNAPGEGRLIYYRDVDFVPTRTGSTAHTAPGTSFASSEPTHTWQDLPPGKHVLFVQLVNYDQTPLEPPVFDSVVVTVGGPGAASASPTA
jgi:hypothetical protein